VHLKLCDAQDLLALVELARQGHAEGAAFLLPFDAEKVAWWAARTVAKHLVIGAETETGELVGAIALDDEAPRYSTARALWDIGFYVSPEHRRSRAAIMLRDAAIAIAADMGLPLFLGVTTGTDLDRKGKFLTRAGFEPIGATYIFRGGP
jgi:GNAT superfamily N-acetyltransferase